MRNSVSLAAFGFVALALAGAPCLAAPAKTTASKPSAPKTSTKSAEAVRTPPIKTAEKTPVVAKGNTATKPAAAATPAKGNNKTATAVATASPKSDRKAATKSGGRIVAVLTSNAPSKTVKPAAAPAPKAAFASPVKVTMDLSKLKPAPPVATPEVDDTPLPLNAAPVPYQVMAARAPAVPATPPVAVDTVLSPYDVELYQSAFSLIDSGDYDSAEETLAQVTDKRLIGYAEYHKLFSRGYTSTYDELTGWLDVYGDEPMAMAVWNLAKRKKPAGAPDPAFPLINGKPQTAAATAPDGTAVQLAAYTTLASPLATAPNAGPGIDDGPDASLDNDLTPKSARSAYNNGQLDQAVTLGHKIGDHWVTGLADWRLGRYADAETEFKFVATDPSRNAWSQSGGAYWAGRCAMKQGHDEDAGTYFKIAASFPFTFYGLLAEQRLGVTPAVTLALKGQGPTFDGGERTALSNSLDADFSWTKSNPKAVRLNALIQIGRGSDAQRELQSAVQTSGDGGERDRWLALAARTHVDVNQLKPADRLFDASLYPMPAYAPKGGFRVDKALVYAFARKESKFNPQAISYSGAYGLLQLMPGTAALIEGDSSFSSKPKQLLKPAVNLRVGQDYIQRLAGTPIMAGDLLRTIAAYNAGPRPVKDALDSLGPDADALLVMESIPVAQTRQYVEEVAANYWIYRQMMGKSSPTLAAAAADAKILDVSLDK